jgi:hypothetical protein
MNDLTGRLDLRVRWATPLMEPVPLIYVFAKLLYQRFVTVLKFRENMSWERHLFFLNILIFLQNICVKWKWHLSIEQKQLDVVTTNLNF